MTHRIGLTLLALSLGSLAQPAAAVPVTLSQSADIAITHFSAVGFGQNQSISEDTFQSVSFAQFDAALGQLTGVEIRFDGVRDENGGLRFSVPDQSTASASGRVFTQSVLVPGGFSGSTDGFFNLSSDSFCQGPGSTSCIGFAALPPTPAQIRQAASFGPTDAELAAFMGAGLFDVETGIGSFISCGLRCNYAELTVRLNGVLSVAYTYDDGVLPAPVEVPEPATLLMLGISLLALARTARRRSADRPLSS